MELTIGEVNSFLAVLATLIGAVALAMQRRAAARGRARDDQLRHYRELLDEQRIRIDQLHKHIEALETATAKRTARAETAAARAERAERRAASAAGAVERLSRSLRIAVQHIRDLWQWIAVDARAHILPTAPAFPSVPDELRLILATEDESP